MNEEQILNRLSQIECELSPENLCMDGEAPQDWVISQSRKLNREKNNLIKILGRQPTFKELHRGKPIWS